MLPPPQGGGESERMTYSCPGLERAPPVNFASVIHAHRKDSIPDATTLWLFREKLAQAGLIERLFDRFDQHLAAKGYMARGGQMVDATIVPVPTQRNSRDENEAMKAGRIPQEWEALFSPIGGGWVWGSTI